MNLRVTPTPLAACCAGILVLVGCATNTTLKGSRLGSAPMTLKGVNDETIGVPYNLTKPVFTVTESRPTSTNPETRYTVAVGYQPDPDHRYTLQIAPAYLTEADFKVVFGDKGQPAEVNTDTREQVTGTLTAIGDVLIKAVSTLATAGTGVPIPDAILDVGKPRARELPGFVKLLDDTFEILCSDAVPPTTLPTDSRFQPLHQEISKRLEDRPDLATLGARFPREFAMAKPLTAEQANALEDILASLHREICDLRTAWEGHLKPRIEQSPAKTLYATLYAQTEAEERLLNIARVLVDGQKAGLETAFDEAMRAYKGTLGPPTLNTAPWHGFLGFVRTSFAAGDVAGLDGRRQALAASIGQDFPQVKSSLTDLIDLAVVSATAPLTVKYRDARQKYREAYSRSELNAVLGRLLNRLEDALYSLKPTSEVLSLETEYSALNLGTEPQEMRTALAEVLALANELQQHKAAYRKMAAALFRWRLADRALKLKNKDDTTAEKDFKKEFDLVKDAAFGESGVILDAATALKIALTRFVARSGRGETEKLKAILELKAAEWRYRHVLHLEREIDQLERNEIAQDESTDESQRLQKLRRLRARTIGVLEEWNRAAALRETLAAVAGAEVGSRQRPIRETPPLADYEIARQELQNLLAAIVSKRTDLTPRTTTRTPAPTREIIPAVFWYKHEGKSTPGWVEQCLEAKALGCSDVVSWSTTPQVEKPEFVIVIEKGAQP